MKRQGGREKRLQPQIYLEQLVILLSQHGSTFNWTGTNSCVLRRFCHANASGQHCFRRFRGGFCEFVCTKLGFLRKPSLIRISLNCKGKGTWDLPEKRQRRGGSLSGSQERSKKGHVLAAKLCASFLQRQFPAVLWAKCYLSYADGATQVRALCREVRWLWLLKISCRFSDTKALVLSSLLCRKARKERTVH